MNPTTFRPGPLGALIDETELATHQLLALVEGLDDAAFDAPRTDTGELRSVRAVVEHVLYAAFLYAGLQRRAFGMDELPWTESSAKVVPRATLCAELQALPGRAWELLADKANWTDDDLCACRMTASWGQTFDLEQLLEHALAHVLRHRRQVAAWLERDGDLRAVASVTATGKGTVSGEAASAYLASAEWYDRLYRFKDYEGEAGRVLGLVRSRHPLARKLLDVACGTGRHLEFLGRQFECEGLDVSPAQLAEARRQLPDMELHLGDMRHFRLERQYDVITCLFSAIGYMITLEDLALACRNMAKHLAPGGLLLIEPWIDPEHWRTGGVHALFVDEPELKLARINTSDTRGRCSVLDMHHLVGTPAGTQHVVEHHELLLATREELRTALEAAGLETEFDEPGLCGRGLWIAKRP